MKKVLTLVILLFVIFTATAQHKQSDTLRLALIKAPTDTAKFNALHDLGNFYFDSLPDSAIIFDQQAYLIAKKSNWLFGQEHELNNIASDYQQLGDYANSLLYYQKSLRIGEQIRDDFQIANINSNIGSVYLSNHDYQRGLPYFLLSGKLLQEYAKTHNKKPKQFPSLEMINLSDIGEAYIYLHKLDSARYYLTTAYKKCLGTNRKDLIGAIKDDLGKIENLSGNATGALQYFREAITADKAFNNAEDLSAANLSIAKFYSKHQQSDSAILYAQTALDVATKGNFKPDILNAAQELYTYYNEANNLPLAFKYFKLSTAVKDSLFSQDKVKQLLSLDFDEKVRQQELLATQARAQNRLRTYILSGGLAVLLLLAIIFWRNSRQRQKANAVLAKTLSDLKSTQNQLVQSAKMASLGELTAGIAHEIQNPLNFVNNFSEVNEEMLEELKAESEKPKAERDEQLEMELLNSVIDNEKKIRHHGKRADFIVKGMLEHSRTSTGERQPTNINVLADEFLKLSYHGLRAKDKDFNAELLTHFDTSIPRMNIVQQDIGRVLINLFSNAFYTVNEKAKTAGTGYKPTVEVSTAQQNGSILISVKDNGTGIPDNIREKIMQPFFTTKPTGEGTGLGLSLSYDIVVKGHNGTLDIISKEGEGAEFIVKLPLN